MKKYKVVRPVVLRAGKVKLPPKLTKLFSGSLELDKESGAHVIVGEVSLKAGVELEFDGAHSKKYLVDMEPAAEEPAAEEPKKK